MKKFIPYNIPLAGLKEGLHQFDYQIDEHFFNEFEEPLVSAGKLNVTLELDKQSTMGTLEFIINGFVITECDRCLEQFNQELSAQERLILKYSEQPREEEEVIYLLPGTDNINVAQYIYEFICLAMPMKKVHPDTEDQQGCDPKVLEYLDNASEQEENENPIWEELKKLKKN